MTRSGYVDGLFGGGVSLAAREQGVTRYRGWRRIWRCPGHWKSILTLFGEHMKTAVRCVAVALIVAGAQFAMAQAAAPAGSTGQCKDGTYTSTATKQGACRGHKGVKEWYAAEAAPAAAPAPAAAARPAPPPVATSTPAAAPAAASRPSPAAQAAARPQAAGGGPGLVWVNSSSNVYHCYGSDYYGKTKAGTYMSEADAKAKGARPDHGKACTK
jgi:hypothetical protein